MGPSAYTNSLPWCNSYGKSFSFLRRTTVQKSALISSCRAASVGSCLQWRLGSFSLLAARLIARFRFQIRWALGAASGSLKLDLCGGSYPAAVHVGLRHVPPVVCFRATVAKLTDKGSGSRFEVFEKREPWVETQRERCGSQVEKRAIMW